MRRAYVFRLRPTSRQHVALAACVEAHRELYNAALQERRDAWAHSKTRIYYGDQSAQLTAIREVRPDQAVWSFSSQQATLRRLNIAFAGFFRRVNTAKPGVKPGYPRFKGKARFDSVQWPKDGDGARWLPQATRVYLQSIGHVKVRLHRPVGGHVKTMQIKRQGWRWMLVLSCEDVATNPLPTTGHEAGIDVGIVSFATTSDGEHVDNPRWGRAAADKLAAASSDWAAPSGGRATGNASEKPWPPGIVRSPTSARTFTTSRPARSSNVTTCWWWRICRSPTCCGGPSPPPIPTTRGSSLRTVPGRNQGFRGVSVTPAGVGSSRFYAPKRKRLGAHGLRWTPGTRRMAAKNAGMQPPKTGSPKRTSFASDARIAPKQTRWPHATSYGLDWPFTPKRREKKPAASSRRRSHSCGFRALTMTQGTSLG